jgi:hypothetical protein
MVLSEICLENFFRHEIVQSVRNRCPETKGIFRMPNLLMLSILFLPCVNSAAAGRWSDNPAIQTLPISPTPGFSR